LKNNSIIIILLLFLLFFFFFFGNFLLSVLRVLPNDLSVPSKDNATVSIICGGEHVTNKLTLYKVDDGSRLKIIESANNATPVRHLYTHTHISVIFFLLL
jgi:hypothetical protein